VFTKDDIHTLANVFIVDPTQVNLLPQSCAIQRFVAFNVAQVEERNYHNQHLINQFLPLTIKVFDYLHKCADMFLDNSTNAIWSLKRSKGLHLSTLIIFLRQKVSITLQRVQTSSILNRVVDVGLVISQLPPVQDTPPITTSNLLQAIGF
jgi:hypothetical protein